jgi:hypothetical protein
VRQRRATHANHADNIDVPHAVPLVVVIRRNIALSPDARAVDDDVDAAKLLDDCGDGRPHRLVVGHIRLDAKRVRQHV